MAGTTYKCQSCGAYLNFDPESQKWKCPFCGSIFAESDVMGDAASQEAQSSETQEGYDASYEENETASESTGSQVIYRCKSCGSEIMTDETTVATHCYYCHSPVVLEGKLTEDMRPHKVLPFTISKEQAVQAFMKWAKAKKYVPSNFFKESEVQKMNGVYYPHYVTNCTMDGAFSGEGTRSDTMTRGDYIITNTHHYRVRREGRVQFKNVMRPALQKANRKLSDGIHPFPLAEAKPFADAYLSGFLAERKDIVESDVHRDVESEVAGYIQPMLTANHGYASCRGSTATQLRDIQSEYVLLPTWVLTYPNPKDQNDPYYFAMNGCTGEICGKLPVDNKKLFRKSALIAVIALAVCAVASYFLF
ncbi:MAG: Sec23/Sec24 zinc finger-containing protein [Clostridiales bacterium]|nr:Sec23/Sec24 zinc finger-containing protein [Clostridiales bacterium]